MILLNIKRPNTRKSEFNAKKFILFTVIIAIYLFVVYLISELCLKEEVELEGWKSTSSRRVEDYIDLRKDTASIVPKDFNDCASVSRGLAWIFVFSAPENQRRREIIRQTWGNPRWFNYSTFSAMHKQSERAYLNPILNTFNTRITFLMGQPKDNLTVTQRRIKEESEQYGDLLQEGFIDRWMNLSIKSLHMLKWASQNSCVAKYQYIIKVDDNIFVNLPNLIHILAGGTIPLYRDLKYFYDLFTIEVTKPSNRLPVFSNVLLGDIWNLVFPIRRTDFKYYCPHYMYDKMFYPPFHSGYLYVISQPLAQKLLEASLTTPIFHLEDVYVTGILATRAKIRRTRHHLFTVNKCRSLCELKGLLVEDGRDPEEFFEAVDYLVNSGQECPTMNEHVVKYIYRFMFYFFEPWIYMYNNYKFWILPF